MEDRLDSYFADSDSGDEATDVVVEEDYFEEEVAGWRPNDNDDELTMTTRYCLRDVKSTQ